MYEPSEVDLAEAVAILVKSGTVDEKGRSSRVIISTSGADLDVILVDDSGDYGPTENFWMRWLSAPATYKLPSDATAMPSGKPHCPSPVPSVPHLRTNMPSEVNFWMR